MVSQNDHRHHWNYSKKQWKICGLRELGWTSMGLRQRTQGGGCLIVCAGFPPWVCPRGRPWRRQATSTFAARCPLTRRKATGSSRLLRLLGASPGLWRPGIPLRTSRELVVTAPAPSRFFLWLLCAFPPSFSSFLRSLQPLFVALDVPLCCACAAVATGGAALSLRGGV